MTRKKSERAKGKSVAVKLGTFCPSGNRKTARISRAAGLRTNQTRGGGVRLIGEMGAGDANDLLNRACDVGVMDGEMRGDVTDVASVVRGECRVVANDRRTAAADVNRQSVLLADGGDGISATDRSVAISNIRQCNDGRTVEHFISDNTEYNTNYNTMDSSRDKENEDQNRVERTPKKSNNIAKRLAAKKLKRDNQTNKNNDNITTNVAINFEKNKSVNKSETSANGEIFRPISTAEGDRVLEVQCGDNDALLYLARLCQGSKGPCIRWGESWFTPNQFQKASGRQTAKDWKRSIRHYGKSMKLLLNRGFISIHSLVCACIQCHDQPLYKRRQQRRTDKQSIESPETTTSLNGDGDGTAAGDDVTMSTTVGCYDDEGAASDSTIEMAEYATIDETTQIGNYTSETTATDSVKLSVKSPDAADTAILADKLAETIPIVKIAVKRKSKKSKAEKKAKKLKKEQTVGSEETKVKTNEHKVKSKKKKKRKKEKRAKKAEMDKLLSANVALSMPDVPARDPYIFDSDTESPTVRDSIRDNVRVIPSTIYESKSSSVETIVTEDAKTLSPIDNSEMPNYDVETKTPEPINNSERWDYATDKDSINNSAGVDNDYDRRLGEAKVDTASHGLLGGESRDRLPRSVPQSGPTHSCDVHDAVRLADDATPVSTPGGIDVQTDTCTTDIEATDVPTDTCTNVEATDAPTDTCTNVEATDVWTDAPSTVGVTNVPTETTCTPTVTCTTAVTCTATVTCTAASTTTPAVTDVRESRLGSIIERLNKGLKKADTSPSHLFDFFQHSPNINTINAADAISTTPKLPQEDSQSNIGKQKSQVDDISTTDVSPAALPLAPPPDTITSAPTITLHTNVNIDDSKPPLLSNKELSKIGEPIQTKPELHSIYTSDIKPDISVNNFTDINQNNKIGITKPQPYEKTNVINDPLSTKVSVSSKTSISPNPSLPTTEVVSTNVPPSINKQCTNISLFMDAPLYSNHSVPTNSPLSNGQITTNHSLFTNTSISLNNNSLSKNDPPSTNHFKLPIYDPVVAENLCANPVSENRPNTSVISNETAKEIDIINTTTKRNKTNNLAAFSRNAAASPTPVADTSPILFSNISAKPASDAPVTHVSNAPWNPVTDVSPIPVSNTLPTAVTDTSPTSVVEASPTFASPSPTPVAYASPIPVADASPTPVSYTYASPTPNSSEAACRDTEDTQLRDYIGRKRVTAEVRPYGLFDGESEKPTTRGASPSDAPVIPPEVPASLSRDSDVTALAPTSSTADQATRLAPNTHHITHDTNAKCGKSPAEDGKSSQFPIVSRVKQTIATVAPRVTVTPKNHVTSHSSLATVTSSSTTQAREETTRPASPPQRSSTDPALPMYNFNTGFPFPYGMPFPFPGWLPMSIDPSSQKNAPNPYSMHPFTDPAYMRGYLPMTNPYCYSSYMTNHLLSSYGGYLPTQTKSNDEPPKPSTSTSTFQSTSQHSSRKASSSKHNPNEQSTTSKHTHESSSKKRSSKETGLDLSKKSSKPEAPLNLSVSKSTIPPPKSVKSRTSSSHSKSSRSNENGHSSSKKHKPNTESNPNKHPANSHPTSDVFKVTPTKDSTNSTCQANDSNPTKSQLNSDTGKTNKNLTKKQKGGVCKCRQRGTKYPNIWKWDVEQVCSFLCALNGCSHYAEIFRSHKIDGMVLPLLTVDQLMKTLQMTLRPAVLLVETVSKLLDAYSRDLCDTCRSQQLIVNS